MDFDAHFASELERLSELECEELVWLDAGKIEVAPLGRIFLRNVAMVFDEYLTKHEVQPKQVYSRTL